MWFKAYVQKDNDDTIGLSKNLYVDIADTTGTILLHAVYPVTLSGCAGSFNIPAGYTGGSLHVLAYTKWMLNFDSAFLYNKGIRILQKDGKKPAMFARMLKQNRLLVYNFSPRVAIVLQE